MKRYLITSAVALVVLGVGIFAFRAGSSTPVVDEPPRPAPVARAPAPTLSAAQATGAGAKCELTTGDTFAYSVALTSTSELAPPAETGAPALRLTMSLAARLHLRVLSSSATGAVLVGRLDSLSVKSSTPLDGLETPFLIEVGTDCGLNRFARWHRAALMGARNQQALLWESQWHLPQGTEALVGEDGLGRFEGLGG